MVRKVVLLEASFAYATGMESQLGLVTLMADRLGKVNIVHYGSSQCHRVSRSLLAAQVLVLVPAFDHEYVIRETVKRLIGRRIEIEAFVDCRTLFSPIAKKFTMTERRLHIALGALRGIHRKGELKKIG